MTRAQEIADAIKYVKRNRKPEPPFPPRGMKYACGHTCNGIIMNDTPLSMSAYMSWLASTAIDKKECFVCYLKRIKEPQTSYKKEL